MDWFVFTAVAFVLTSSFDTRVMSVNVDDVTGVLFSTLERLNQAELEIHTLKSQTKQLDLLETDIYTLRKENRLLFQELSLLRSACVTPSKTETLSDADKLMNSTYNVSMLNKRLLLDNQNGITPQRVAFSVGLTHTVSLGELQPIEFNKVLTNIGNGYNANHGHFITPVKGVYILSTTVTNMAGQHISLEIVKNGVQLAALLADGDDYNIGSQTIMVALDKDDVIWVRHFFSTVAKTMWSRTGEIYNTFSGALLFEY